VVNANGLKASARDTPCVTGKKGVEGSGKRTISEDPGEIYYYSKGNHYPGAVASLSGEKKERTFVKKIAICTQQRSGEKPLKPLKNKGAAVLKMVT